MRYHFTPIELAEISKSDHYQVLWRMSHNCDGILNWYKTLVNNLAITGRIRMFISFDSTSRWISQSSVFWTMGWHTLVAFNTDWCVMTSIVAFLKKQNTIKIISWSNVMSNYFFINFWIVLYLCMWVLNHDKKCFLSMAQSHMYTKTTV